MGIKFELKSKGYDMDIYEYMNSNGRYRVTAFHRHDENKNTVEFVGQEFVLRTSMSQWIPMSDANMYSGKYGHWESASVELNEDMIDFAKRILSEYRERGARDDN